MGFTGCIWGVTGFTGCIGGDAVEAKERKEVLEHESVIDNIVRKIYRASPDCVFIVLKIPLFPKPSKYSIF
jgi:hypothetical protein